jgi:hypothetical protein
MASFLLGKLASSFPLDIELRFQDGIATGRNASDRIH